MCNCCICSCLHKKFFGPESPFCSDCMAVVVDSIKDVRDYLDESGADISGMSDEELEEASEVFALPNGQYLIVEG